MVGRGEGCYCNAIVLRDAIVNILQSTGQPSTTKNDLAPNVSSAEVETLSISLSKVAGI